MNTDYYNQNLDYIYELLNDSANEYFIDLKNEIRRYINTFCLNENDIKEYYFKSFENVKEEILSSNLTKNGFQQLFTISISNDKVKINKDSFEVDSIFTLNIPRKELIKNIMFPVSKSTKDINDFSFEDMASEFKSAMEFTQKVLELVGFVKAELVLKLSLKLSYLKHLLNEHKENESDYTKGKGFPSFDLYQRYLILTETTDIATDIRNLTTSPTKNKYKLLAILLNCSIDNARHLLGNSYKNKLQNIEDKTDEVNEFIYNLKIKN